MWPSDAYPTHTLELLGAVEHVQETSRNLVEFCKVFKEGEDIIQLPLSVSLLFLAALWMNSSGAMRTVRRELSTAAELDGSKRLVSKISTWRRFSRLLGCSVASSISSTFGVDVGLFEKPPVSRIRATF